jgi:oligopeptide transport system substrate-binding protein
VNKRALGLLAGLTLLVTGCESSPPPVQFADDQVLRLVAPQDVLTLDPAKMHQPSVGLSLARNVFGGLYKFRDDGVEVPDLARSMPNISPDGLTWTFHLRTDARFSNGNPVKAADVLYSWNRVASLAESDYDSPTLFSVVVGYADLQARRTTGLSGLTATDDHTVVAKVTAPSGFWLVDLGLPFTAVIDKNVVAGSGEETWWTTPEGLVGTGPFRMTSRAKGRSLDFEPVTNWWGGSTGRLKRIHVDVVADRAVAESRYKAGDYDIVGYTPNDVVTQVSDETIKSFLADKNLRGEVHTNPWLETFHLDFRGEGRLGTAADVAIRRALSLALDRKKLAGICQERAACVPATGGFITKGLAGYLGDGADPNAKYDVGAAKALLRAWDPTGSRLGALRVATFSSFGALAEEMRAEWRSALGIEVQLDLGEFPTIRLNARKGLYDVTIWVFYADYDSPHNWLSDMGNHCHPTAVNPQFTSLVAAGDKKVPADALGDYKKAGQLLADDAACPALAYQQAVQLIKPWVRGAGTNALYEYYWTSISILKH